MSAWLATSSCSAPARKPHAHAPRVEAVGLSDVGLARADNEDAYAVEDDRRLYTVADGLGGHAAGEVASAMAINSIVEFFRNISSAPAEAGCAEETEWRGNFVSSLFARAVEQANALVWSTASGNPDLQGMATTFTGLLFLRDRAVIAHVGDSRAYLLRGSQLRPLTDDHTWGAARAQGTVAPATWPPDYALLRAVGSREEIAVDTRVVAVEPGDTFLLATDGLHGFVEDAAIMGVLLRERDLTAAAKRLVERANEAGGYDNVTVVLVRVS